jgi:hypothetical protein
MEHGRLPSPAPPPPLADTKSTEEERNKNEIREKKARTEIAEIVPKTEDPSLEQPVHEKLRDEKKPK